WLRECQPTWYSAVPTIHQAALARVQQQGNFDRTLRLIRSSSAAMPARVMAEIEAAFGVPVIEAYGMTEASHQMTSNPLPPAARKPRSVGRAGRTQVAIAAVDRDELLSQGDIGEVVIRGEAVTGGYLSNPEANAKAFFDGWFRTGDRGYVDADGYLFLQGRLKEMVNRGGENISPLEVDEALMALPDVHQAVAFAVPHPTLGEDLAAAVVLKPEARVSSAALREYLFEQLVDFKVPSQIVLVDAIPKGATGKLQRIGLADKLADRLQTEFVAPQSDTERAIAAVIQEVLQCGAIGATENFFVLGGDSLKGTQVTSRLSAQFGLDLPNTILFRYPTVAELAVEVERAIVENSDVERLLAQLEGLPPEDIERMLAEAET
ncbi:MAG: non-ribosomal peptide synthetase, partial [Cyanobacteria bacterium J06648_11]